MRIAACVELVPRKLGSLEQWLLRFAEECVRRQHRLHLFWHPPVHPEVADRLHRLDVSWTPLSEVDEAPLAWSRTFRRSYDLIYLNLVVPRAHAALAAYLAWPVPVLYFDQISGGMGDDRPSFASRLLDPLTFQRVRSVAGCSRYVSDRDRRRFRLPAHRVTTIYNGSDPDRFRPAPRNAPEPILLAAAYLIPEKGIDVLVRACARISALPWRLVIVGDGPELERLRALAAESGLAHRIEFTGLRDDVDELMQTADIFVHPAIWQEAFGLTITEAMASGCATVASMVGGIPEIIEPGRSGMLFPPGDDAALADALRGLLQDPVRRQHLGLAGRERVKEHFTMEGSVLGQLDWIERRGKTRE